MNNGCKLTYLTKLLMSVTLSRCLNDTLKKNINRRDKGGQERGLKLKDKEGINRGKEKA